MMPWEGIFQNDREPWCVNICLLFYRADIDTRRAMESLTELTPASPRQASVSCSCVFHHQYFNYAFQLSGLELKGQFKLCEVRWREVSTVDGDQ